MSLFCGSLCYTFYISTFILTSYRSKSFELNKWYLNKDLIICIVYIAAAVNGFGASILWVAAGEYVSTCANESNKGLFNSTFWAIFMSSNIIGYLMSAFVLGEVKNDSMFYIIMTTICFSSSFFFLLLRKPTPHPKDNGKNVESKLIFAEKKPTLYDTWELLTSKKMFPLLPMFVANGYSVALYSAMFIPFMTYYMEGVEE